MLSAFFEALLDAGWFTLVELALLIACIPALYFENRRYTGECKEVGLKPHDWRSK